MWTWSEEHVVAAKKNRTKGRKEEKEKEERGKRKKEPVKGPLPPHDDVIGGTPAHRERERERERERQIEKEKDVCMAYVRLCSMQCFRASGKACA